MVTHACKDCPETFELIPPADTEYCIPREKAQTEDYIERFYECPEGHKNTIYWEKEEHGIESTKGKWKDEPYQSKLRKDLGSSG